MFIRAMIGLCSFIFLTVELALAQDDRQEKPDPLPRGALHRLGTYRFRSHSTDSGVILAPGGDVLAFYDTHFQQAVVSVKTGEQLPQFAALQLMQKFGGRRTQLVAFSPDGKSIIGIGDKQFRILDVATGKTVLQFAVPGEIRLPVAVSADAVSAGS
jgi:WD40 repeat protein